MLRKLFLGDGVCEEIQKESSITRRVKNLKMIWDGHDYGIERLFRLFLALSQFIFFGTYIRQLFGKSSITRDVAIDIFVVIKISFGICILSWGYNWFSLGVLCWFLLETILYTPTLIFASDYLSRPRSYKRAMILFFFNYIEIIIAFGCFYFGLSDNMSKPFESPIDAVYFSIITASTTGYGDYFPITTFGKTIVMSQSIISILWLVLFLNFFSSKIENKGYFGN